MTQHEQANQNEQPSAGDSNSEQSLHTGGIQPEAEAVLQGMEPHHAEIIRGAIAEKNSRVEQVQRQVAEERRALERDLEYAGIMRECMQDSEFADFVNARERGDLATFYRQKAGLAQHAQQGQQAESSLDSMGEPAQNGNAEVAHPEVAQLSNRLQRLEADRARLAQEATVAKFASDHPDWVQYKTLMQAARQRMPSASLDDLYYAAKGMMADNTAAGEAAPDTAQNTNNAGTANAAPPFPVGQPPGSTSPAGPVVRTMADALAAAKRTHGISGDVAIKFDG